MLNKKISLLVLPILTTLSLQANDPMNDPFFQDPFGDDIFKEMMLMQQNMDRMFNQMQNRMQQRSSRLVSPLGTYKIVGKTQFVDKSDHYEYISNIPENKENQIDINVKDGVMSITAKIIEKHESKTANGYSSSRAMRMYQQSMPVPADADENSLTASYKNAKLVISMKKKTTQQKATPHIRIQTPAKTTESKKLDTKKEKEKTPSKESNSTKTKTTLHSDKTSMG